MSDFRTDLKHAFHMFVKNPGFTIAVVAALALGIGADTAIFSVVNAVLLKPLSYPEPDRIVQILLTGPGGEGPGASATKLHVWQEQTSVFQDVAGYDFGGGMNLTGAVPEQVHGVHVTESYFRIFGAKFVQGRPFTPEEDRPHGGNVVVISGGLWKRKFGSDPSLVGKAISIANLPYTVVGITSPDFDTDPVADLWIPYQFDPNTKDQAHYFVAAARMKPGISLAQVQAQLKLASLEFNRKYPGANERGGFDAQLLKDSVVSDIRSSLLVLIGAVSFVLLIACANVANLLMVRAAGRSREFAIRAALGAGRARIIRQLLTESVLLALTGGLLGLVLGMTGVRALLAISPGDIPRIGEDGAAVGLDWRVALFTFGISLLTGILFGLIPALAASKPDLSSSMKESSKGSGSSLRHNKMRSLLVVSEVSLALVLLVGASLLIRTFVALRAVDPGFNAHNVWTAEMALNGPRFEKTAGVAQVVRVGREQLNAVPGVITASVTNSMPLVGGFGLPFIIVGKPLNGPSTGGAGWMAVSPGYFDAFKIPIVRGRDFTDNDTAGSQGVAIINEAMAKEFWKKDEDPVGQQIIIGHGVGPEFEEPARLIVGIVGDVRDGGLNRNPGSKMVVPLAQMTDGLTELNSKVAPLSWVVRTRLDPHQMTATLTEQLRKASGGFPVARVRSMEEVVVRSTARQDFNMLLLSIFGGSALVLAAIGIYGLMAYSVQQRTQEIGIRMAMGADRKRITRMVVWQGMRLTLAGVAIGVGAAFALTHLISSLLYGVKNWDPTVFVSVPLVLSGVALVAVWLPALRAAKLNPMEALRTE
ncbi:ABC transporter permease [Acidicapsa acidisoli]|uniref:ABC transporter permease n=1 Tax=Acidicapsa acidisoli TaxID=1615681 RepID=UPI0021DFE606|nr:ABC transporter permease [Acidicapsa acidisoli]